jgi:DNA gyrase subunit A
MDVVVEKGELLVVMENGYGKRTAVEQFTPHHRGGIGIKGGVVTTKTGNCIDVRVITSTEDDLMIISTSGQIIRVPLANVSKIGRATQGVRIMRLPDGDKVSSVALVHEPEEIEQLSIEAE